MARSNNYIPIFDSLPSHKKEMDIRGAMGWNGFESVGFLVWFWLQVAADFPEGELPGLDELKALLKRVWKAAGIKPKNERIQLIAETIVNVKIVDVEAVVVDDVEAEIVLIHDWEDGAGMFEVSRQKERDKKRIQREQERLKRRGAVPGTAKTCPPDVPGEKKKKQKEKTPPNPPQAGGEEFSLFFESVLSLWEEARARLGLPYARDSKTTLGADNITKMVMAGDVEATREDLAYAMTDFLKHIMNDAQKKDWNLNTLSGKISNHLPKKQPAARAKSGATGKLAEPMQAWTGTCDKCTFIHRLDMPLDEIPDSTKCPRPGCTGNFVYIKED